MSKKFRVRYDDCEPALLKFGNLFFEESWDFFVEFRSQLSLIVDIFYNLMDNAIRYGLNITNIRFTAEECIMVQIIIGCEDDWDSVPEDEKEKIINVKR